MVIKHFTLPACGYEINGKTIKADGTKINKVTGTAMAGILNISHWSTPFSIACRLLGLADDADIGSKPAVIAGKVLEDPIIKYMDSIHEEIGIFVPAEDMFALREGDHDSWASDFEDDYFAGHVDGIVMAEDGNNYILEVKTSSNLDDWANGVPEYYYWQVALYNHFITKQDKAYVALGIMNDAALRDPTTWTPNENNCVLFTIQIDQEAVAKKLEVVREWYNTYIRNGVTPEYDPNNAGDVAIFEHLVNLTDDDKVIAKLIDEDAQLRAKIDAHEAAIKEIYDAKKALDARLKDYLVCHDIKTPVVSGSGMYKAVLSESSRREFDEDAMRADGVDPEKYKRAKLSKTFTIKAIKN